MPVDHPLLEIGGIKKREMPQLYSLGKLAPHAPVLPFANPICALKLNRTSSPRFLSLDCAWDFKIVTSLEQVSTTAINHGAWSAIQVPGNWTMHGFGHPHYSKIVAVHELKVGKNSGVQVCR